MTGAVTGAPATSATRRSLAASSLLVAATIGLQIAYPLTPDRALGPLTVITVIVAAAFSLIHGAATRGATWTSRFATATVLVSLAAEAVGVATGWPFGSYDYGASLGPALVGVPLVVPLAWLMMAYPARLLAERLTAHPAALVGVGALTLAAWDVFLDPQLVAARRWTWHHPSPGLPGVNAVPLTNLAGWLVVGAVLIALTLVVAPTPPRDGALSGPGELGPAALPAWTWLGGVIGNAAFFGRPAVAAWGGALLGVTVAPYLLLVARDRRAA